MKPNTETIFNKLRPLVVKEDWACVGDSALDQMLSSKCTQNDPAGDVSKKIRIRRIFMNIFKIRKCIWPLKAKYRPIFNPRGARESEGNLQQSQMC